jgi:hypothetical protein
MQSVGDHGRADLVFDGGAADIQGMRRGIETDGCFVIRRLFDLVGIARILARAEQASAAWDFMVARGYAESHEDFVKGVFAAGHIPGEDIDVAQTILDLCEKSSYDAIAFALFGNASHGFTVMRIMRPSSTSASISIAAIRT